MYNVLITLLALLLVGCASPTSTTLVGEKRAAIAPEQVQIYTEKPENYEPIALLSVTSDGSWSFGEQAKMDAVIRLLKQEAAKVGANGVLLQATADQRDNSIYVGTGVGRYSGNVGLSVQLGRVFGLTDKTAEGLAIYVKP
ncbi:hypothetical protein [Idiomarina aquatica]|uniref:Lipoprotein n=1 Tax=Idiomarina aquatica TaxID=1327752 RepID=A0AA94ED08_9GAMM|nr:hypothetical protein [Idiomarina aquatica]RUO40277.1 hypothetical protein CWE23_11765 [Idiomarina aquatica]